MDKKQEILTVAMELFKARGLGQVSIDDIARECKISKATFYKYFANKESVVYEGIFAISASFVDEMNQINEEVCDQEEKLQRKLALIWNQIFTKTMYNIYVIDKIEQTKKEDIRQLQQSGRRLIVDAYKSTLTEYYGEKAEEHIWELVFCVDAVIHQFMFISRTKQVRVDGDYVAQYAMAMLHLVINNIDQVPKITEVLLNDQGIKPQEVNLEDELVAKVELLGEQIQSQFAPEAKAMEAYELIQEKIKGKEYDSIVIDGMAALLEKEGDIKSTVREMVTLRNRIVRESDGGKKKE